MIRRIVVPIDFSEASTRAAHYAVSELAPLGAEVVLVTVLEVSDLRVAMHAGLHGFDNDDELHEQVVEWLEEQFERLPATARREIRRGIVEREIVEAIHDHDADLVVMGAAGIARRIPIGSKAEYVLRHVDVPLLLVKPRPGHVTQGNLPV
jgi:nucleotide-binding universal stress UspA family protein